jgi:hypothetical protein
MYREWGLGTQPSKLKHPVRDSCPEAQCPRVQCLAFNSGMPFEMRKTGVKGVAKLGTVANAPARLRLTVGQRCRRLNLHQAERIQLGIASRRFNAIRPRAGVSAAVEIGAAVDSEQHSFAVDNEGSVPIRQHGLGNQREAMAPVAPIAGP